MWIELMDRLFPRICGGAYRSHCDHHELDFRPMPEDGCKRPPIVIVERHVCCRCGHATEWRAL